MHLDTALILVSVAPLGWAITNVIDKTAVSKAHIPPMQYAALCGLAKITIALCIIMVTPAVPLTLPIVLSGVILGCCSFFYMYLMRLGDASDFIAALYCYIPLLAIGSWLFIGEVLTVPEYLCIASAIIGATAIGLRLSKMKLSIFFIFFFYLIFLASSEFFQKIAAVDSASVATFGRILLILGLTNELILFRPSVRRGFFKALPNLRYAFATEIFANLGYGLSFLSMQVLPVTFVSAVSTSQAFYTLIIEKVAMKVGILPPTDHESLIRKLVPMVLVVGGVLGLILMRV